jgi:hypothetical protein
LPTSTTAIKAHRKTKLMDRWNKWWAVSPHYPHIKKIDSFIASWHTYRMLTLLPRRATSIWVQLCTGHIRLNISYVNQSGQFSTSEVANTLIPIYIYIWLQIKP